MPITPEEFYARAAALADAEGRLPAPPQSEWDIFPFESDSLVVRPLQPPALPEPPRGGEEGRPCWRCSDPDAHVVWSDERWVVAVDPEQTRLPFMATLQPKAHLDLGDLDETYAAELGVLTVRLDRAIRDLGGIGRVHVNKWGDGGAHLHLMFLARPAGLLQLRGSCVTLWEEMLPLMPAEVVAADAAAVARALAAHSGRAHV